MSRSRLLVAAVAVALLQIGFLSWIVAGRAAILRDGKEVLLKVEPVDPRDFLRGDYVRLRYEGVTQVPLDLVTNIPQGATATTEGTLYVRLRKDSDGYWRAASASLDEPPAPPPGPDEADLAGRLAAGWDLVNGVPLEPEYGIGRFYLPEGEGLQIEKDMRVRPFGIRLAVADDGTAQIKALMDGETLLFEEALY
jgi:uncharacterized membrane-anchored protein